MFGFDSKDCFFVFRGFFGFEMEKPKNNLGCFSFFEWVWSIKISKKTKNSILFLCLRLFNAENQT